MASERESNAQRVHRALKRIAKTRAALDAEEIAALREAQRLQLWREFGCASLVEYMERELLYTPRAAVERLRVANIIEELPAIEAALKQGNLSFSGARELSRVVTPETQEAWLDAVQNKNVRQIEELVAGRKRGDSPDSPVEEEALPQRLRFEVSKATAAIVRHYQKLRAKELGALVDDDVLIREVFQLALDRMVDDRRSWSTEVAPVTSAVAPVTSAVASVASAVARVTSEVAPVSAEVAPGASDVELATSKVAPGASDVELATSKVAPDASVPRRSSSAPPYQHAPRYQHAITTCDSCKRGWLHAAGTRSLMTPAELECARCDADELGYADAAGPVRKRSKIPPAVRRKILMRDGHRCRVPGCRSTNIDVHHLLPEAMGGSHDQSNLLTLCEGHHRAVHNRRLIIKGVAPDVTFEFATLEQPANHFAIESRAVETQRALEQLGFKRHEAAAAVRAARTHVGTKDEPIEIWLKAALQECRDLVSRA